MIYACAVAFAMTAAACSQTPADEPAGSVAEKITQVVPEHPSQGCIVAITLGRLDHDTDGQSQLDQLARLACQSLPTPTNSIFYPNGGYAYVGSGFSDTGSWKYPSGGYAYVGGNFSDVGSWKYPRGGYAYVGGNFSDRGSWKYPDGSYAFAGSGFSNHGTWYYPNHQVELQGGQASTDASDLVRVVEAYRGTSFSGPQGYERLPSMVQVLLRLSWVGAQLAP